LNLPFYGEHLIEKEKGCQSLLLYPDKSGIEKEKSFQKVSGMEIIRTDVLIIGGGGAGMEAALAAKGAGAEVCLVAKSPAGKSTCTYLSGGAFSVAAEGFSKEEHLKVTLASGKGINARDLVEILVEESPERIRGLEPLGVPGEWRKGRFYCLGKAPSWGAPMTNAMAEAMKQKGVKVIPWIMVFKIIKDGGKAVGALGFNFRSGKWLAFLGKAVILANGGGGALYRRHDNPVRITGDGYALGFEAGCSLRDMEFVQFIPPGLAEPGKPTILIAPSLSDVGRVVNSAGENVLEKYNITEKPVAVRARDAFSLAIFNEEMAGRDVFLDLRAVSEGDWPKDNMAYSQRPFLVKNVSCMKKPIRISPMCHHFMGGVVMDPNGGTEVPGLFAAGEVAGGVHGANRMGGNALAEILVFGWRAGIAAADWAKRQGQAADADSLLREETTGFQPKGKKSGPMLPPGRVRRMIAEILWKEGGILRSGGGLKKTVKALQDIQEEDFPNIKAENSKEILEKLEVEKALLVGEMIVRSALLREESRGAHFRSDFPKTDDQKWKGNIFLKKGKGGMELEFRPLR
jgi:fumarate reductase (CoM/CoB) subunit A